MAKVKWNGKRTLEHCSLITYCEKVGIGRPNQKNGKCDGYQRSYEDDEPCEKCSRCKLYSSFSEMTDEMGEDERLRSGL